MKRWQINVGATTVVLFAPGGYMLTGPQRGFKRWARKISTHKARPSAWLEWPVTADLIVKYRHGAGVTFAQRILSALADADARAPVSEEPVPIENLETTAGPVLPGVVYPTQARSGVVDYTEPPNDTTPPHLRA